ncbi:MAG TPA: hypothetical protein VIM15_11990 [Gemmatimonadaceae bacterium]
MFRLFLTVNSRGAMSVFAALALCGGTAVFAQSSGNIELHANRNVTAASIGLPEYPGARSFHGAHEDSTADLGLTFGDFHFRLLVTKYVTRASAAQVLEFYRKPLARYGEVLECDHGLAVGSLKVASSGLTCSDTQGHHAHSSGESRDSHELRSGTPRRFRMVGIDDGQADETHFSLVLLELPKDSGENDNSK